jgi:hypothetical protein
MRSLIRRIFPHLFALAGSATLALGIAFHTCGPWTY